MGRGAKEGRQVFHPAFLCILIYTYIFLSPPREMITSVCLLGVVKNRHLQIK